MRPDQLVRPPSHGKSTPVTHPDVSSSRSRVTHRAISSGSPNLSNGVDASKSARRDWVCGPVGARSAYIGVWTGPGRIAFARTCGTSSRAHDRVRLFTAAFVAP